MGSGIMGEGELFLPRQNVEVYGSGSTGLQSSEVYASVFTEVPPAKKITFYKSGDPQFGGVKMAINQRSFKSFNALMDDLSHRVPLPFGVRTITTPRGIHCISTLDQLEDGGCYLCSDKKYVMPISLGAASGRLGLQKTGQPARALRKVAQEVRPEEHSAAFAQPSPRIPKKITLLKNGDIATQRPITLNRRNARSLKALLDEISEIMQFTVKKLYTVEGKRVSQIAELPEGKGGKGREGREGMGLCHSFADPELLAQNQRGFAPLNCRNASPDPTGTVEKTSIMQTPSGSCPSFQEQTQVVKLLIEMEAKWWASGK
uniref:Doublecortin domain-containing protein n=1 Tax=Varanus komodoensis TaxID=61221 RepID=A0A8D2IIJ1_VARKO